MLHHPHYHYYFDDSCHLLSLQALFGSETWQPSRILVSEHRDRVVILTSRVTPAPPADQTRLSLSQLEDTSVLKPVLKAALCIFKLEAHR